MGGHCNVFSTITIDESGAARGENDYPTELFHRSNEGNSPNLLRRIIMLPMMQYSTWFYSDNVLLDGYQHGGRLYY